MIIESLNFKENIQKKNMNNITQTDNDIQFEHNYSLKV